MEAAAFYQRHALAITAYRYILRQALERLHAGGWHQAFRSRVVYLATGQAQQADHCRGNAEPG